ncbi:MAG: FHA domain-containing protein [Propionibacteriaceae bacterium]
MPFCTSCGHDNPASANFCAQCGAPITRDGAQEDEQRPTGDTTRTIAAVATAPPAEERDVDYLSAEDEAAVNALPQGSALLIVRRGSNAGSRFLLNTDVVKAGRTQDSDIFLDDISVSRRHCIFTRTSDGTLVKDVGSLNGTYVNREVVVERLLQHGDEVQIGKFRLVYFASPKGLGV